MITQFYGDEVIQSVTKSSNTVITLPSGSKIKLGGVGSYLNNPLSLDTSITGVGGLESSIVINTLYYVYVVLDGITEKLIGSVSSVSPLGFNSYRKVGAFHTNIETTDIEKVYEINSNEIFFKSLKVSAAAYTAASSIAELSFTTLTLGKIYSIQINPNVGRTSSALNLKEIASHYENNGLYVASLVDRRKGDFLTFRSTVVSGDFVAAASALTYVIDILNNYSLEVGSEAILSEYLELDWNQY